MPTTGSASGIDLVNFTLNPKNPGAFEEVRINMESFAVDLNTANIAWYLDREKIGEGLAKKEVTVRTGDFGTFTTLDIVMILRDGTRMDKQIILAPSEIDVLWEAQTYTPPFYRGKALPTFKSNVRLTAFPRVNRLESDPKQFYFKWTANRTQNVGEALGKNSVVVPMGYDGATVPVTVDVTLPGQNWTGQRSIFVPTLKPKVVLYPHEPLHGTRFRTAWSQEYKTSETEFVAYAVPYFFSLEDMVNNRLVYTWEINRRYTAPGLDARYLTIPKVEDQTTPLTVSFRTQNPSRILQEGRTQAKLLFTE